MRWRSAHAAQARNRTPPPIEVQAIAPTDGGGGATAAFRRIRPEIVFHLAAQSVVRSGVRYPLETFETNVMGTARLLDAAREADPPAVVVVVTSDKV